MLADLAGAAMFRANQAGANRCQITNRVSADSQYFRFMKTHHRAG